MSLQKSAYLEDLEERLRNRTLLPTQAEALRQLQKEGFPDSKHEAYRYTPLGSRLDRLFAAIPSAHASSNGEPAPDCSMLLQEAFVVRIDGDEALWRGAPPKGFRLEKGGINAKAPALGQLQRSYDPFAWEHAAATTKCLHIEVQQTPDMPLALHFSPSASHQYPHLQLHVRAGAQLRCIELYTSPQPAPYYQNSCLYTHCEQGAKLENYILQCESARALVLRHGFLRQEAHSHTHTYICSLGEGLQRNNLSAQLIGKKAKCSLWGLQHSHARALVDNHTHIQHAVPSTQSHQNYRALLKDRAKGIFSGRIHIHPQAQHTEAYQSHTSLLLSPQTKIHAQPQLEIYADDVRCSHGCVTKRLDPEQIFYLRARGMQEPQARNCLLAAFLEDMLTDIPYEAFAHTLRRQLGHEPLTHSLM